jgi:hypothetical protein
MQAIPAPTVIDSPGQTRYQFGNIYVDAMHQHPKRLGNEFTHEFAHYYGHETGFHLSDEFRDALQTTSYPFGERATLVNDAGDTILEGMLLDASIYPIGTANENSLIFNLNANTTVEAHVFAAIDGIATREAQ